MGDEDWIEVESEFATVRVRKRRTRNGERLEIAAPLAGTSVELVAIVLEALTWLQPTEFSKPLEHPHAPEGATDVRSLSQLLRAPGWDARDEGTSS